jgi:hypothetical protein
MNDRKGRSGLAPNRHIPNTTSFASTHNNNNNNNNNNLVHDTMRQK